MKRFIKSVGIGVVVMTLCVSAKSQVLTMDKAVEMTLEHSPDIEISRFDFKAAIERTKFQEGYTLPRLDLGVTAGRQGVDYDGQDNLTGTTLLGTITASQLLYDFGKTSGMISASDQQANAYEATMNQLISKKILEIKARYYDVLKMENIIKVNKKNIKLQEDQLRRAQRYYDQGIKTIIDVSDGQVRLEQAKRELNNSEYDLKLRRALLEQTIGSVPYNGNYRLTHAKLNLPNVSHTLPRINTSLSQLVDFAYDHRYELQSSEYLVQSAQSIVESTEGDYLPTFALRGDYTAQDVDDDFAGLSPDNQWQAGVGMTWNLFAGKQTDASVQEAKIASLKASSRVDEVRLRIKTQVIESTLNVKRTKDSVILSESIAKASEKKYMQALKRYENDLADYVELQDSQLGYIRSLSELVVAYYDYYISIAQLDFAVGR
ncbi:MAG: TolC family protein [Epsilonproteobacteria bacterium]|nr:MAG: TolC family protein [Campylobacterota bacterium]